MRTLLTALTALMLFSTPVVAGDWGDGVDAFKEGDYQKAFRLWKPLAEQGNKFAQGLVGVMYDAGEGVPKDDAKAAHWYRKAAEQGFVGGAVQPRFYVRQRRGRPQERRQGGLLVR